MLREVHLGLNALYVLGVYMVVMIALGFLGRAKRKEQSLRDFYLGGSSFGFIVLFLTLFATQYSGNTLLGFSGQAYTQGGTYVVSIMFMILAITVYVTYGPRLFRLSRKYGYITPADFIYHRFGSHPLRIFSVCLLIWALANYILEQLVAMGQAVEAISDHRLTFMQGVFICVFVMLVYETLGGMRSVAWTDVVQGVILLVGLACMVDIVLTTGGGLTEATRSILETEPKKMQVPAAPGIRQWFSTLILLGLGVALYPQGIQRFFAARSLGTLRRSLGLMAFMPFTTTLLAFLIGIIAISRFPNLGADSDKVTIYVLASAVDKSVFHYWMVVMIFAAVVAAIMSTADSVLLSMGSMFTKDIYRVYINPTASSKNALIVGKVFVWGIVAVLIGMSYISLKTESSIWFLIKLKLEFLVQVSPVFVLGVFWKRLTAGPVLAGMITGTSIAIVLWAGAAPGIKWWETASIYNISAGVWGLAANYAICIIGGLLTSPQTAPASDFKPAGLAEN